MKALKIFAALFIVVAMSSFIVAKTYPGWKFIGDKIAAYGPDRDVLYVTGNDNYRKIKIRVTDAPLYIYDMDVYFDNGEKMNVPLKNLFHQGDESRVIDLPGGVRNLSKITFVYETKGVVHGKARVAVWGLR